MRRIVPVVYATRAEYIDPLDCDSIIAYSITRRRRQLNSSINLSDCNRKIMWYFEDDQSSIKKIDKVIELLTSFRREFVSARAKSKKRRTRKG